MKIKRILALVLTLAFAAQIGVFADPTGTPTTFAITVDPTADCSVLGTDVNGDVDLAAIPENTVVTLTATFDDTVYEFDKWQKKVDADFVDVTGEDETWEITVTENMEVKALIKAKTPAVTTFAITVDPTTGCSVSGSDVNGAVDLAAIPENTVVTLTATIDDAENYEFDKWQKKVDADFVDVTGEDETWEITVTENMEVKALIKAKETTPVITAPAATVVTIGFATETVKYDEVTYIVTRADKTTVIGSHDPDVLNDLVEADEIIVPGEKIYVRNVAADPTDLTMWTEITIPTRPVMSYADTIYSVDTSYSSNDGQINNLPFGIVPLQYSNDGTTWYQVTNATLYRLGAGTYYVRICANDTAFASENKVITINRMADTSSNNNNQGSGEKYYSQNGSYGMSSSKPTTAVTPQTPSTAAPKATFGDIETHWAKSDIVRAVEEGLFNGVAENTFDPDGTTTRGMIITIIARMDGADLSSYTTSSFGDVASGEWYSASVEWGNAMGIVTGTGDGFAPNGLLTREQIATIIYRYAEKTGKDVSAAADISTFADYDSVSEYALQALAWANSVGIINGRDGNTLSPQGTATRAEVATMLIRYMDNIQ